jgi:hypothetical protein
MILCLHGHSAIHDVLFYTVSSLVSPVHEPRRSGKDHTGPTFRCFRQGPTKANGESDMDQSFYSYGHLLIITG